MSDGKLFQSRGAAAANILSPKVLCSSKNNSNNDSKIVKKIVIIILRTFVQHTNSQMCLPSQAIVIFIFRANVEHGNVRISDSSLWADCSI